MSGGGDGGPRERKGRGPGPGNPPDESGEDDDRPTRDEPSGFADLVGETKPLRDAPARVDPRRKRPEPTPPRDAKGKGGSFRFPDPDEPRLAAASGTSDAQLRALQRGEPAPEERIDLHGVRSDAAPRLLAERLASARSRGLAAVVVIHGRGQHSATGEAVLRDGLPGWLSTGACARHVRGFAPATVKQGGDGATLVLLRRR